MTIFWILAAGIAFLAVLFVIAPLLRPDTPDDDIDQDQVNLALFKQQLAELDADLAAGKLDQAQYDSARRDIEREVLYDVGGQAATTGAKPMLPGPRATLLALLLAVPVSALVLYLALGERQIIPQLAAGAVGASATGHAGSGMPPLEDLVARLEQRMQQVPDDAEGWTMLGRTYFATGQTDKAEQALARAYELMPKDATVLLAYAESIAANQGNDLAGRPADLIGEALAADPDNATARWLSGMVAYQHGQFSAAAVAWKKALAQLDPDSDDARELQQLIEQAEQRAGVPPEQRQLAQASGTAADGMGDKAPAGDAAAATPEPPTSARAAEPAAAADSGAQISVQVSLDPALADRAAPDTTVFVYAKAPAGPPMPLAVQRVTVADLPATLTLDDSMAMMPAMKLSGFPQVIVGARVSASGQAMPRPGDLEGETGPISSSSVDPVEVRIDSVRP
jgi:cytochrome c-type biogenesis protein CcmH